MLFSLEGWEKKKKPWGISLYDFILLTFLLPLWTKIFAGLVKNWLTSIICSVNLGILLFKIQILLIAKLYSAKFALFRFVNCENLFRKNFPRPKFLPLRYYVHWSIGIDDFLNFWQIWLPSG